MKPALMKEIAFGCLSGLLAFLAFGLLASHYPWLVVGVTLLILACLSLNTAHSLQRERQGREAARKLGLLDK